MRSYGPSSNADAAFLGQDGDIEKAGGVALEKEGVAEEGVQPLLRRTVCVCFRETLDDARR